LCLGRIVFRQLLQLLYRLLPFRPSATQIKVTLWEWNLDSVLGQLALKCP
jgi:hypothetical protein